MSRRRRNPRSPDEVYATVGRVMVEKLVPVAAVLETARAAFAPRHVSKESVERWITRGISIRPGFRVHLDGLHRPGAGWLTSHAAFARFVGQLEEAKAGAEATGGAA